MQHLPPNLPLASHGHLSPQMPPRCLPASRFQPPASQPPASSLPASQPPASSLPASSPAPVPRGGPIDFFRIFECRVYRKYRISGCIFDVRTAKVSHFRVYFLVVCPEVPQIAWGSPPTSPTSLSPEGCFYRYTSQSNHV